MFCICTFLFSRWFQILCSLDQWTQFWSSFDRLWINLNWQYWLMPYWLWLRQKSENFKCPIIFFGAALACKKVLWISRTGHRDFCCYGSGSDTDTSCFGARSVGGASSFNILAHKPSTPGWCGKGTRKAGGSLVVGIYHWQLSRKEDFGMSLSYNRFWPPEWFCNILIGEKGPHKFLCHQHCPR